jgi:hypothetical protein
MLNDQRCRAMNSQRAALPLLAPNSVRVLLLAPDRYRLKIPRTYVTGNRLRLLFPQALESRPALSEISLRPSRSTHDHSERPLSCDLKDVCIIARLIFWGLYHQRIFREFPRKLRAVA